MRKLDNVQRKTDELVYQMIPRAVARRLRNGENPMDTCEVRQYWDNVTKETKTTVLDIRENLDNIVNVIIWCSKTRVGSRDKDSWRFGIFFWKDWGGVLKSQL